MKRVFVSIIILSVSIGLPLPAQTTMPSFAKLGYKKQVMYTSSKGEFEEFHDQRNVVEIGTVLFNTKTNQVAGFITEDNEDVAAATIAMSIDPLCEKYYWISPYAYCLNNPVRYVDPQGKDVWDFLLGVLHSVGSNLSLGVANTSTGGIVSHAGDYNTGRDVGDIISAGMGLAETIVGGGTAAAGAAATVGSAGVASPVSVPVVAAGAGMVAHGTATTTKAAVSLVSQDGRISQAEATRGGGKSNISSGNKNSPHANQKAKQSAEQKYNDAKAKYDELKTKPNKTKEENVELKRLENQRDHWKKKQDFSGENHSRNAKGN